MWRQDLIPGATLSRPPTPSTSIFPRSHTPRRHTDPPSHGSPHPPVGLGLAHPLSTRSPLAPLRFATLLTSRSPLCSFISLARSTFAHAPLEPLPGTCPYGRAWAGTPRKNNDHRQRIECSGQGVCERKTGQCACKPGFWGEGCRRSACPNSCSGHGTCQSIKAFAEDYSHEADDGYVSRQFAVPSETEVYNSKTNQMEWIAQTRNVGARYDTAWDADYNYGCKCDQGFRGPDCSKIECPSLADPLGHKGAAEGRDCSGRGTCDYTVGVCECFRGFYGGSCEYMTNLA